MKILCLLFAAFALSPARAAHPAVTYVQLGESAVLYTRVGDSFTPLTALPKDYFAAVTGESDNGYTPVAYLDLTGWVKDAEVTAVDFEPVNKFETTVCFRCNNDGQPVNLRSAPDHTDQSNILTALPPDASGHSYGKLSGTALLAPVGTDWYYVRYNASDKTLWGYVYSGQVAVDPTPENVVEKVVPPADETPQTDPITPTPLDKTASVVFIVALCVPAVFIMFILFRKPPKERKPRHFDS